MNAAEGIRNRRIHEMRDVELLKALVSSKYAADLSDWESTTFVDMLSRLESRVQLGLSTKQRETAEEVARRVFPIAASAVPPGKPVQTPEVLRRPLPLKPPGR